MARVGWGWGCVWMMSESELRLVPLILAVWLCFFGSYQSSLPGRWLSRQKFFEMLLLHCLFLWPTRVKRGGETAGLRLIARFAREGDVREQSFHLQRFLSAGLGERKEINTCVLVL